MQPITDEVGINISKPPLNGTDTAGSREFHHLVQQIMDDTWKLLFTGAVDHLVSMGIGWVTQITILFTAVATYSGELLTFASLFGKAKAKLKGPLLTLAFVYVLETAYMVLQLAMFRFVVFVMSKQYGTLLLKGVLLLLIGVLLLIVPLVFHEYFSFMCSLSIIVAVAEPGCHGAGAVGQARRLMKGKLLRALLFTVVTVVLHAAIWPVLGNMESGLLRGFLYTILMAAVEVFDFCTKTAFYYECKGAPRHELPVCLPKTR
jgi:hypothetical protein